MDNLISVIIPIYNVEKYLERCVNSVINQSYRNLEIILVDDGSTDTCYDLCDSIKRKDSRIKVIHKENKGLSSARNTGLDIMQGTYVMFVDSDDYISKDCIEYLYGLITKYEAPLAIGNFCLTCNEKCTFGGIAEKIQCMTGIEAIYHQFDSNTIQMTAAWAKLYDGSLFKSLRFQEGMLHEDEGMTYKILYYSKKVVVSNKPVYAYYCNPESITKRPRRENYEDLCLILKEQIEFYRKYGETILEIKVKNRYCIQAAAHYLPKGYYGAPKFIVREAREMYKEVWRNHDISIKEKIKGAM